jgi:hypothetical protein
MGVCARGFSVIVRNKTLEERFPGGLAAFQRLCPNQTFCTDQQISRIGFMHPDDANAFIAKLAAAGLEPFRGNVSVDVALSHESGGFIHACDWLELGMIQGHWAARLLGAEPVNFFLPEHELKAKPFQSYSMRELRESFDLVEVRNSVECYRNKASGELIYIGRTGIQKPRKWWQFWKK